MTDEGVIRVRNEPFASNTYIVRASTPGTCLLVDPGLDRIAIERALDQADLLPVAIFVTHGHFDHLGTAEHFRRLYSVPLYLHPADQPVAQKSNFLLMSFGQTQRIDVPETWTAMEPEYTWSSGHDQVSAIHAPGHTPGSTILDINGRWFTGDTIYRDDVWLTRLPDVDRDSLVASLRAVWNVLPDDALVHPGHGGSATFGRIKETNRPLRALLGLAGAAHG